MNRHGALPPKEDAKAAGAARRIAEMEAATALADARAREKAESIAECNARAAAAREAKAALVAEGQVVWEKRQARRARIFLTAARRHMSPHDIAAIWEKAGEMFPGDIVWEDMPSRRKQSSQG